MTPHETRIGRWHLRLERDAAGRVKAAGCGVGTLRVDWSARRGVFHGPDGDEAWSSGRARGEYLDLPYGHEVTVDDALTLEAWVERRLRDFRGGAFFEGLQDPRTLRALFALARQERVFDVSVANLGARAWAERFAAIATDEELAELTALLDDAHGRQYLAYARAGAGKKRAAAFRQLAIPDGETEARAAKAAQLLLKRSGKTEPAFELNRTLNNRAAGLIDADDPSLPVLLAATSDLVLARLPAEESFGGPAMVWAAAAGEFFWRANECRFAFKHGAFPAAVHHARRAERLENLLHDLSEQKNAPAQFTSSAGSWAFSSILAEIGLQAEASARFGTLFDDASRLKRRARDPASLQAAFVAGFYATWKRPLPERGAWPRWFELARKAVPKITSPLWAAWTADLWRTLDDVAEAREALLGAQRLGHDVMQQLKDPHWEDFLARHRLQGWPW